MCSIVVIVATLVPVYGMLCSSTSTVAKTNIVSFALTYNLSEKKVFKVADSTKKCLAKCVMPSDDVDFMELIDYENSEDFTFEEASGDKTSEDGNSSDYDQFLELSEKNLGDDCPDDFPDGFCEAIKKLLKKLRERSDGDGIIRPKSATALK